MYSFLLFSHSLVRWIVLAAVLITLIRSYYGWLSKKTFTKSDNSLRIITLAAVHIQATLGLALYFISPVVKYFFNNFKEAVHEKEFRFFGMEHSVMMLTAAIFISIAAISCKRQKKDLQKFKVLAIWFSIAVLIILFSVPWNFGEITANRPWIRSL
jgi:glucan phosphoethanolaminetransferase (alkaline phosphatase superfamily)